MDTAEHDLLLSGLGEHIAAATGLVFPRERWPDLMRGIEAISGDYRFKNRYDCIAWLLSEKLNQTQIHVLAKHLTIGETYFFRDAAIFELLQTQILPQLIAARRPEKQLRIWSAGCSTGEEAYSIAIMLQRTIPDWQSWNISILGTDLNAQALQKAEAGIYSEWSFRRPPPWLQEAYFSKTQDGRYQLASHVRRMVSFSYLNLTEETYPSHVTQTEAVDIIFCRNVLMYLKPGIANSVSKKFARALRPDGWLCVGAAETSLISNADFDMVHLNEAILHQKSQNATYSITQQPADEMAAPRMRHSGHHPITTRPPAQQSSSRHQRNNAAAMRLMVRMLANRGDLTQARLWCEKAVASDKLNPEIHYLLATILQEQGQMEEAVLALKKTLYLDQDFVLAHFALGNLFRQQAKRKAAEKHFDIVLRLLNSYSQDDVLAEPDGMTAGRLRETVQSFVTAGKEQHEKAFRA